MSIPVGVIDDVVTRWWSSHDAAERILHLREAIEAMHLDREKPMGKVVEMNDDDWSCLKEIVGCLKPFRSAQKLLEGEKYVTASLVCPFVDQIRNRLNAIAGNNEEGAKDLAKSFLKDFNVRWLKPDDAVFNPGPNGKPRRSKGNRQVGIHPVLCVATLLDPRTKALTPVRDVESKERIKDFVLGLMEESET